MISTNFLKIPPRFSEADFNSLPQEIKTRVDAIRETRKGLLIHGNPGTGKTYAAYGILKHMPEVKLHATMYSAPELFDLIRDDYKNEDSYNFEKVYTYRGVLIIDDLGVERPTEWVLETFYKIINKRYEEILPVIITSNFDISDISERLGDRIASRLVEMCDIIELKGDDRRLSK